MFHMYFMRLVDQKRMAKISRVKGTVMQIEKLLAVNCLDAKMP